MTTASTLAVLWRHGRRLTLKVHFKMSKSSKVKGHLFLRAEARLRRLHEHMGVPRDDRKNERDGA